jgi:hypothetical protein
VALEIVERMRSMSLLSIRRERRDEHRGPNRPPRLWRLIVGLILVCCCSGTWDSSPEVSAPRIFLSAGEPSGDLHGARLAEALRGGSRACELYGLGGDRMRAAGVELLAHVDQLAVMGFVEVLRHLPYFVGLMRR